MSSSVDTLLPGYLAVALGWLANCIIAYWCERPELFAQISAGKNEEARALLVLKWFIVSRLSFSLLTHDDRLLSHTFRAHSKDNILREVRRWAPKKSRLILSSESKAITTK